MATLETRFVSKSRMYFQTRNTGQLENETRPPLVPSEKSNVAGPTTRRKLVTREIVGSMYKSASAGAGAGAGATREWRCASPLAGRSSPAAGPSLPKRAQSAERRRPATPLSPSSSSSSSSSSSYGITTPLRDTVVATRGTPQKRLTWPSTRTLTPAFQTERVSIPVTTKITTAQSKAQGKARRNDTWQETIGRKPACKESVLTRPRWAQSSPVPGKALSAAANGRTTPVLLHPPSSGASCIASDYRKGTGKRRANQMEEMHQLKLMYNRVLQWRFVNARILGSLSAQKTHAEGTLYSVWDAISDMRDSVITKRVYLQNLRRELMLNFILKEQIDYLENWEKLEKEHCNSLSGTIQSLKASTLRIPLSIGTRANLFQVRNAIGSAIDVMQSMDSSIYNLFGKVEDTRSLLSELYILAEQESSMISDCRELLSMFASLQVQESSLRTHLMQLRL